MKERPKDVDFFALYEAAPVIRLGSSEFQHCQSIISINGRDILSYRVTKEWPRIRFRGVFHNKEGVELFRVEENEWIGPVDVWDVEQVGTRLRIDDTKGHCFFDADTDGESNVLHILRLDLHVPPFRLWLEPDTFAIAQQDLTSGRWSGISLDSFRSIGANCAVSLDAGSSGKFEPNKIGFSGDAGIKIHGTGISIADGGGVMTVGSIDAWQLGRAFLKR